MTIPHDMPGLSKRRLAAMEDARRKADLARCGARARKDYEAKLAALATGSAGAGERPKRKRARRAANGGTLSGAQTTADRAIDWPFTDETIEAYDRAVGRYVAPRAAAQEARREGDPHASPRDYIFEETP